MKYIKTFEDKQEKEIFINYMLNNYGEDGVWSETFNPPLTIDIIEKYIDKFIKKRKLLGLWGFGDSFDRENFRDYLLFKLGQKKLSELEYNIRHYLTELEIETDKYNL